MLLPWLPALTLLVLGGGGRAADDESLEQVLPGWDEQPVAEPEQSGRALRFGAADPRAYCRCAPAAQCSAAAGIGIRIVNTGCAPGALLCCVASGPSPSPSPLPLPPPAACGRRSVASDEGAHPQPAQARFGEFPWQAMLLNADGRYMGSGALVGPRHVLTAAHVLTTAAADAPDSLRVRLGEWDTGASAAGAAPLQPLEVGVRRVAVHPEYDAARSLTLCADLALLELAAVAPPPAAAPHVRVVCLPPPSPSSALFTGRRCWVSGWGRDAWGAQGRWQRRQRAVDVSLVGAGECEARLRATRLGAAFHLDARSFLCAGGEPGKDACSGDGGAPLVCPGANGGGWEVVGLVSWGVGCGDAGVPGVYTNVASFTSWVQQQMAGQMPVVDPRNRHPAPWGGGGIAPPPSDL